MKRLFLFGVLLLGSSLTSYSTDILAYYEVKPTQQTPDLDGKLNDTCWEQANEATTYYKYLATTPTKASLKSSFKMLYHKNGIYLGITNHEKNIADIRAKATARDDVNVWRDDCAEIYFDPTGSAIGFVKFATNSLGILWDMKRIDAAISLPNWSGNNWRAATSKTNDSWTIEAFFPWSDLGKQAKEGDIWRFNHVRYTWPNGKFKGASWSLGGTYASPDKFGYICFTGQQANDTAKTVDILSKYATPPWMLLLDGNIITYDEKRQITQTSPSKFVVQKEQAFTALKKQLEQIGLFQNPEQFANQAKGPASKQIQAFIKSCHSLTIKTKTPSEALESGALLTDLSKQGTSILWAIKVRSLITNTLKTTLR